MLQQKGINYNWYYASFTYEQKGPPTSKSLGLRWLKFVVFASTPKEAQRIGTEYALSKMQEGEQPYGTNYGPSRSFTKALNLYQKNYIREARKLVEAGQYAGTKPEGV